MATQARSIASLTISFGLVAIPVKLYSATVSSERLSFNLLRQKDASRVKQQYVAVNDGKLVERSEMVKGYEFATDLRKSGQCAVGRWISRGKEHIVVIRPIDDGLALHQLHFKAEVRDLKDLGIDAAPVSEPELKLAQQLIEHLAAKRFDPNEYADEHRARVQAAIQKKVEGKEVSLSEGPVSVKGGNVIDLMEAL